MSKNNCISTIKDKHGTFVSRHEDMSAVFDEYFRSLFQSTNLLCHSMNSVLQKVPKCMTDDMNAMLLE